MTKRYLLLTFLAFGALLGALVAAMATIQQRDFSLRGYVDATRTQNLPFRVPRLGVNAELTQYQDDELITQLDLMAEANIIWVRQIFPWDEIEITDGDYDWSRWDRLVGTVGDHPQLRLVAVLMNSPDWSRVGGRDSRRTGPPDDPAMFARFARAFALRYGDQIDHYQIWDEPNLEISWGGLPPRPVDYAALLHSAYQAIHAADGDATVIAAGLAPTQETDSQKISDLDYLRDLYALGVSEFADALAAKPFGFNFSPEDRTVDAGRLNFSRIVALREIMVANGDGQKALWASGWGWNSLPSNWEGKPSIWGNVTAEQRVQYTQTALDRAEREWPWLAGMILHHWQPAVGPNSPQWGFALIDQAGTPGLLWEALAQRSHVPHATNGLFSPQNPYAQYAGLWTFSDFGADIGWVQDSHLEFYFSGSDLALLLRQDNYVSYLYPTVDGEPANALPQDVAGNAYILLRSGDLEPELSLVAVARGLDDSPHALRAVAAELVPDESLNRWPLVGYAVSSGGLATPYNRQIKIAWLTAGIALLAVLASARRVHWRPLVHPFRRVWRGLRDAGQLVLSAVASLILLVGMFLTWSDGPIVVFRRDSVQLVLSVLTSGLIYLNEPGLIVTILAGGVLFVMIYQRPEFGLILTMFWAPFFLFPVELYHFAFPMAEILILITAGAWLVRNLVAWSSYQQISVSQFPPESISVKFGRLLPLDYAILTWIVLGAVSLTWAERQTLASTEFRALIVQPALFYLVLRTIPLTQLTVARLVDALLLAGFGVAVVGLFDSLRGEPFNSVYGSPNNAALLLGRCVPFVLAYILVKGLDRRRRIVSLLLGAVILVAILLTRSAGAIFIGVPLSVAGTLIFAWRGRAIPLLIGLVVAAVIILGVAVQLPQFTDVLDFSQGPSFFRLRLWQSTFNMLSDHPVMGVGLDQFLYQFRGTYIMPDAWQEPNLSHPHNVVLDFWVRLGILGVLVLVFIQVLFWKRILDVYRWIWIKTQGSGIMFAFVIGVTGSMLNLLGHGLVDNSVYVVDLAYVFMLLLGLSVRLSNISAIDERT